MLSIRSVFTIISKNDNNCLQAFGIFILNLKVLSLENSLTSVKSHKTSESESRGNTFRVMNISNNYHNFYIFDHN